MELIIDDKKLPFSADISMTEDGDELFIEADFEGGDWKKTFFSDIPEKEIYKQHKKLQNIYDQLEAKLTKYVKDNYPDIKVDWDMLVYEELLVTSNTFKMSAMIDQ